MILLIKILIVTNYSNFLERVNLNGVYIRKLMTGLDFSCVTVTLISCLALGVEIGLLIGVLMGVTHLIYKASRPPLEIELGKVSIN